MNKHAFTIMEVIIVTVIIGVIAAFAVPNYQKSIQKAIERNGVGNLLLIHKARETYKNQSRPPQYPGFDIPDLASINSNLSLGIVDNRLAYACAVSNGPDDEVCWATHPSGWVIHFHALENTVHCKAGPPCPKCLSFAKGGCKNGKL